MITLWRCASILAPFEPKLFVDKTTLKHIEPILSPHSHPKSFLKHYYNLVDKLGLMPKLECGKEGWMKAKWRDNKDERRLNFEVCYKKQKKKPLLVKEKSYCDENAFGKWK